MPSAANDQPGVMSDPGTADRLIGHEQELTKLEEERIQGLENQATAILALVVAIAAFAASVVDKSAIAQHRLVIGAVAFFMFLAAGFATAARGPRALKVEFWGALQKRYGELEKRLRSAEETIASDLSAADAPSAIVESWRARRAVTTYLAERKALWVTCALGCLLLAFAAAALAALVIVG